MNKLFRVILLVLFTSSILADTIVLNKNWNLIGLNANLTLQELQDKLGDNNILAIQGVNENYKKSNLDFLNSFTEFKPGKGYWIKLASQTTLEYMPTIYANKTIQLTSGWNLINPMSNLNLSLIKTQIGADNLEVIQGVGEVYKKNNLAILNTFTKFKEPNGYWIKISIDSELDFASWYKPDINSSWQWQLQGDINSSYDVDIYDIDLFDTNESQIQSLQKSGKKVICYFSAGSFEDWRDDAKDFPPEILGKNMDDWKNEQWLDIRSEKLRPIILARLDKAAEKGCDGVEPDNVDGYTNDTNFSLTSNDQLTYNKFLANEAHKRGLSIGLKNNLDQVLALEPFFDFAVNEQCHIYNECDMLQPFIDANKPVLNAEYADKYKEGIQKEILCQDSLNRKFATLILPLALDDCFRISCEQ